MKSDLTTTLIHLSKLYPQDLANPYLQPQRSQVVTGMLGGRHQRQLSRLHRIMRVESDEEGFELLHVKFQLAHNPEQAFQVFEVQTLMTRAFYDGRTGRAPAISSAVIMLTGPEELQAHQGQWRLSPPGTPFCGVRFQVDPIYQKTVRQLQARGSAPWLAFAPLARDVTADSLRDCLALMRQRAPRPRRMAILLNMMATLTTLDQRRRGLRGVVMDFIARHRPLSSLTQETPYPVACHPVMNHVEGHEALR